MILALDLGTTRVKGAVFMPSGACVAIASSPFPERRDADPLVHEAEAGDWLSAAESVIGRLLAERIRPSCVVVSGNGPTLVPVDAEGRALHGALTWMDRRAAAEAEEASITASSLAEGTAVRIDPSFYLPKALWFARHLPAVHGRTAAYLGCPEYLVRALTGECVTVFPGEGWEPLFWKGEWLEALGLERRKFPPFVEPGRLVGTTSALALPRLEGLPPLAPALGLPEGIPVVAGGPDFLAALVGTATTRPGRACDRAGTSEGINLCSVQDVADRRLLSMPHVIRPFRNISGAISTSGKALEWWKAGSGQASRPWDDFLAEAEGAAPCSGGLLFLPYLAGERAPIWDAEARGSFVGLTLAQGRPEMTRAVVESTALAIRDVLETMAAAGARVSELRVTGRPGTSAFWNQVKADVTGVPIVQPRFGEAELLGGACMGFVALGRHASLAEAAEALVEPGGRFEPEAGLRSRYDALFALYRESYAALAPLFPRLGALPRRDAEG